MTIDQDNVRAKIAKLMALGQDPAANEFEAEAAMRQAEKLMRKFAIDAAEIVAAGKAPKYDWQRICVPARAPVPVTTAVKWFGTLCVGIAKFTDCAASWKRTRDHGMCIEFRGDYADLMFAVYLAKHLRDCVRRDSQKFAGTRREREDFRHAMVSRIYQRMEMLKQEQRADLNKAACGNALVVVDNKIALRDEAFGQKPKYGSSGRRSSDSFAREAGRAAGDKVGFGRPFGGDSQRRIGA